MSIVQKENSEFKSVKLYLKKLTLCFILLMQTFICLMDFNGLSTRLRLFYAERLGNKVRCMSTITFCSLDDMLVLSGITLQGYFLWY